MANEKEIAGANDGSSAAAKLAVVAKPEVKNTNWAEFLKPVGTDIIDKGFKLIDEKDYNAFDKLMSKGAFGEKTYALCTVVNAISSTYVASQQAEIKRVEMLQSFMRSIQRSNEMVLVGFQEARMGRLKIKEEASRRYDEAFNRVTTLMASITTNMLKNADKKAEEKIPNENFITMLKQLDKMMDDAKEVFSKTLDSVSKASDEDEVLLKILEVNKSMVDSFRVVVEKSLDNAKSITKTAIEAFGNLRSGGANKPGLNKDKKVEKKRQYEGYTAKIDWDGSPQKKELSFKEGDVLYVYKKELNGKAGFFKAAKSKEHGAETGLVQSKFIRPN